MRRETIRLYGDIRVGSYLLEKHSSDWNRLARVGQQIPTRASSDGAYWASERKAAAGQASRKATRIADKFLPIVRRFRKSVGRKEYDELMVIDPYLDISGFERLCVAWATKNQPQA